MTVSLEYLARTRFASGDGLRVYREAFGFLNHMLLTIWSASFFAVFFQDMRIRLEGFDLAQLAAAPLETPSGHA